MVEPVTEKVLPYERTARKHSSQVDRETFDAVCIRLQTLCPCLTAIRRSGMRLSRAVPCHPRNDKARNQEPSTSASSFPTAPVSGNWQIR